ncbi:adenylate kinase [Terfezia boudieri ATCC MYA-4762]|uniref:GTP:AMP phosphotransferase, mitochondrial n=1 Tax=Terfezia boudieri ATCC MYA-4762 TaxID=1051890 RepID=A0A3N4LGM5_9PEZI|nr:adenylate kinase [Terfezia boudieri ATCC MYA-4762]
MSIPTTMAARLRKAARVILVGPPGCGKGTQTTRVLNRYPQLTALSSGDLLRQNVRAGTPIGLEAESIMKNGGLVHDSLMVKLIVGELSRRGYLESKPTHAAGLISASPSSASSPSNSSDLPSASFLLDGFPRTQGQAKKLDEEVSMNLVVNIDVPSEVIIQRISNRLVHTPSGRIYNLTWNPPKVPGIDDVTGEPLTRRSDDFPETFKKRLEAYRKETEPLLEHYDKAGVLWTVKGRTSDEITPLLEGEIKKRFG